MDTLCAIGGGIAEELFGLGHINPNIILPQYLDEYLLDCISKQENKMNSIIKDIIKRKCDIESKKKPYSL